MGKMKLARAETAEDEAAAAEGVRREVLQRNSAAKTSQALVALAYPGDSSKQEFAQTSVEARPLQPDCELAIHHAMVNCESFAARSGYALQFQRIAVNLCADENLGWHRDPATAAAFASQACDS